MPTKQNTNQASVQLYDGTAMVAVWPAIGVCMAAFAIRLALARGDLWGDEAASVTLSFQPVGEILATLARSEPHPPLYPLFLKLWMRLVGTDELLVRLPSIFAGTALAATSVGLGRTVGVRVGIIAGLLTAISPFLIWYSTESRMYPFAALGAALSVLSFDHLIKRPRTTTVVGFALSIALALLSHYFALFVACALGIISIRVIYRERWLVRPLAAAWFLGLLPFVVWGVIASRIVGTYYGAAAGSIDIPSIAFRAVTRMGAGWSIDPATATGIGIVSGCLVVVSLVLHRSDRIVAWSGLWLVSVFLIPAAISLVRPMYQERYLIVAAPAYLLILAVLIGCARSRVIRVTLLAAVIGSSLLPIANMANGTYVRSQYGSHTREVNALGTINEAVVLNGPSQYPLYSYYASRGGIGLPVFALPRGAPAPEPSTSNELGQITQRFSGIWLFLYAVDDYDPARIIEQWLNAHAFRAPPRWTVNGRLIRYVTDRGADLGQVPAAQVLAPGWTIAAALPKGPVAAGSLVPILVDISSDARPQSTPKLRLRLIDDRGFLWGEADEPLGSGFATVDQLVERGRHVERRAIGIAAGASTGTLRVEGHLYREDARGIQTIGTVNLGTVNVESSDRFSNEQISGLTTYSERIAGLTLIGSSVASARRTGERGYVTTVWRSNSENTDLNQVTRIVDANGKVASIRRQSVSSGRTPLRNDQVIRIQSGPAIGANWLPGDYQVQVGLTRAGTAAPEIWTDGKQWLSIGQLRVTQGVPTVAPAPPEIAADARFGEVIDLVGYSVVNDPLAVTLQWRAQSDIDRPWTVFIHVVDQSGNIIAQSDGQPARGSSPTDGWAAGDLIDDRHELGVNIQGAYRLVVGLYNATTGNRLIATTRTGKNIGDSVNLGLTSANR